jgi:citrate synthase
MSEQRVISGLEGVLACESAVAFIDGQNGVLLYRGYDLRHFADSADFLAVVHLLWHGDWPSETELATFRELVRDRRELRPQTLDLVRCMPLESANPIAALRTAISLEGVLDTDADIISREALIDKATSLLARLPTLVTALARRIQGREPIPPDPELDHATNYLYMLYGSKPAQSRVKAVNTLLTIYAEHELNASTFTARTVASTLSDYYSAVTAGIAALKGPLHGGAVDDAMRLFQEIREPDAVGAYLDKVLGERRRIPGFGHRVYRTRDPRAFILEPIARELSEEVGEPHWFEIAQRVEREMIERKGINANVDYYASLVLYCLGFPLNMFTCFIASSRLAGWTAHLLEQYADNRLIRPRALYRGPTGLTYRKAEVG